MKKDFAIIRINSIKNTLDGMKDAVKKTKDALNGAVLDLKLGDQVDEIFNGYIEFIEKIVNELSEDVK